MTQDTDNKAVAEVEEKKPPLKINNMTTAEELFRYSQMLIQTGHFPAPKGKSNAEHAQSLTAKMIWGSRIGFTPEESTQYIYEVHGRLAMTAKGMLARATRLPDFKGIECNYTGTGDNLNCQVAIHLEGKLPFSAEFSMQDAKLAGLNGDNWRKYPKDMLRARAISRATQLLAITGGLTSDTELNDGINNGRDDPTNYEEVSEVVAQIESNPTASTDTGAEASSAEPEVVEVAEVVDVEAIDAEQATTESIWDDLTHDMKMLIASGQVDLVQAYKDASPEQKAGLTSLALEYESRQE